MIVFDWIVLEIVAIQRGHGMKLTKTVGPPFAPAVAIGAIASEGKK